MERGESIFIKQTVQVTVHGQLRTLEIALPIPVDARREDIERLLDTADTGMELLSTYLEDKVNELLELEESASRENEGSKLGAVTEKPVSPVAPKGTTSAGRSDDDTLHLLPSIGEEGRNDEEKTSGAGSPKPGLFGKIGGGVDAARAKIQNRRDVSITTDAQSPLPSAPVSASSGANTVKPEMSLKQFLAEAKDMGFNPTQVLQILGRKTLTGIDFKESLRTLREHKGTATGKPTIQPGGGNVLARPVTPGQRQISRQPGSGGTSGPVARPATTGQPPPAQSRSPLESSAPSHSSTIRERGDLSGFLGLDEDPDEDELDRLGDESDEEDEDESAGGAEEGEVRVTRERWETSAPPQIAGFTPGGGKASVVQLAKARSILEKLRANRGGIKPQSTQLYSFRNIVQEELGLEKTRALLQAIWKVSSPDQLTSSQINAITDWGKSDSFASEAEVILDIEKKG